MRKLSYKTLLIIFFFLLIAVIVLLKFVLPKNKVEASWWNDSWSYRKAISISNTSGSDLTDFQISLSVGTSALIASGKMQSDCDDIRVTDINGNLLPYWIEENNPGCNQITDTKIWIKTSSLPTSGSTVYLYYGNTSAASTQSGTNTFEFFDDFNDANKTITNWTATGIGYTITGGNLYHSTTLEPSNSFATYTINNSSGFTNGIIESRMKPDSCGSSYGKGIIARYSNDNNEYIAGLEAWTGNYTHIGRRVAGAWTNIDQDSLACSTSTWYQFKWTLNGTNQFLSVNGIASSGVDSSFSSGKIGVHVDNRETPAGAYWDYLFVRKYASVEPISILQSEESGGGPIAYWKFDEGVGTTAYDSSGQNNTGTFLSAPIWKNESECVSGKCLAFDNVDDGVSIANKNFAGLTNYTMSAWINIKGTHKNYAGTIMSSGNWNTSQWVFGINQANTAIYLYNNPSKSYNFQLNKWTHVTVTRNGSLFTYYIDGKSIGTASGSSNPLVSDATNTTIGRETYAGGYFAFNGWIDEPKIYPYARTAAQIKQDYNSRGSSNGSSANLGVQSSTAPSLNSKLVAYWKLDENNGTKISNSGTAGIGLSGVFAIGNSAPTWVEGKKNKGLNFNGNNYLTITDSNNSLDFGTGDFTLSFFTYKTANGYQGGSYIGKGSYTGGFDSYDNMFRVNTINGELAHVGLNATLNQWEHHLFVVTQNSTPYIKHYINGKLNNTGYIGVGNTGTYGSDNSSNFIIGYSNAGGGQRLFNGIMDEIKIYNTALTDQEILQDYNQGSAIQMGSTNQTIGGTTTSLEYCIPGDTSYCASPVAEWKMDERTGTSVKDTSGNNNTGTLSTGTAAPNWTTGKIGAALKLNGESASSYISTQYPTIIPSSYTAEAWINPSSISGTGERSSYGYTIMAASADGSRYPIWITLRNGEIRASAFAGALTYGETVGANIQTNQWYHIAVSATQNSMATIYVNGIGKTSFTASNTSWSVTDKLTISDLRPDRNISFNGKIDHIKIYDYARTPAQIAYDYNKGEPIGWWKLDDCQGLTAFDSSGLGNTGTIVIGASGSQNSLGTCSVGTSAAWTNGSTGKINSSLNFDGTDDYISINNNNSLNLTQAGGAISLWFKTNVSASGSVNGSLVAKTNGYANGYWFTKYNNKLRISLYGSSNLEMVGNKIITDNLWHHAVANWTSTNLSIYIDGNLDKSQDYAFTFTTATNPLYIARMLNTGEGYFAGKIDDVRIYNYALTSEQIKTIYNGGAVNFN